MKCIRYIGKANSDALLGSNTEPFCIQNSVVINCVIKRLRCIKFTSVFDFGTLFHIVFFDGLLQTPAVAYTPSGMTSDGASKKETAEKMKGIHT